MNAGDRQRLRDHAARMREQARALKEHADSLDALVAGESVPRVVIKAKNPQKKPK